MGTTTDKLNKLLETKEAIKTAIKAKNVSVSDSDPFSAYADKIESISTGGGTGSTSGLDWSEIGYSEQPQSLTDGYDYAKQIYDSWNPKQTSLFYNGNANLVFFPLVDTSNVTSLYNAFYGCSSLISMPLINTSKVTTFEKAFYNCSSLKDIALLDMTSATTLKQAFYGCSLKNIPLFDTSNIQNFQNAFENCSSIETVPSFDMSSATITTNMFYKCNALKTVPSLNTINVTDMSSMFSWSSNLESVGKLNADKVTNIKNIFYYCNKLANLGGFTNLSIDLDLTIGNYITATSLMNVINEAKDLSTEGSATLTIGSKVGLLTEEQIAIATAKGWTLA